jgi:SAM-dependent methyltransferase
MADRLMQATADRSLEQALSRLAEVEAHARRILPRLRAIVPLAEPADVLDIGAAQGLFCQAVARMGHRAVGVEPSANARATAEQIARRLGAPVDLRAGWAEALPLPDASFDLVHANSVWEHVDDPQTCTSEAWRVLRPGGVFWVGSTNAWCPRQSEISGFPMFSWYPDRLKKRIMCWARDRRPRLVGHSARPAMHWFTPPGARRMLRRAGFSRVYDRWDLRLPGEGGPLAQKALRLIRASRLARTAAWVLNEGLAFAAVK